MRKQKSKKVKSKDALRGIRIKPLQSELGWTMDGGNKRVRRWNPKIKVTTVKPNINSLWIN
jgi:hypothetical protein